MTRDADQRWDTAIIGAGPAGMSAAIALAELKVRTIVLDSAPLPGGQYYKQTPFPRSEPASEEESALFTAFKNCGADHLMDVQVWGISADDDGFELALYRKGVTHRRLWARTVIIATGAYDRTVPFPGWDLPGVMLAGGALTLIKHQGTFPGRRVLLCGTGPLQWLLARHLLEGGVDVAGIVEAAAFPWKGVLGMKTLPGQGERLREGLKAWSVILRRRIPVYWGKHVVRAEGEKSLERVHIGAADGSTTDVFQVDTLCLGYGFQPFNYLARMLGCEHYYHPQWGGWVPYRDDWCETRRPGVFVAGDAAGIRGKDVALLEGRLAAWGVARRLGKSTPCDEERALRKALRRQTAMARFLADLFPFPFERVPYPVEDDTLICRCEEVRLRDIRTAIREGAHSLRMVRMLTRAGMGLCQGRTCADLVLHILAQELGVDVGKLAGPVVRPPLFPIPLEGLVSEDNDVDTAD